MKTIDEIVTTFINDLKRTKEYKEAWRNCEETKEIIFNFRDRQFYNSRLNYTLELLENGIEIVMDEEILLGR